MHSCTAIQESPSGHCQWPQPTLLVPIPSGRSYPALFQPRLRKTEHKQRTKHPALVFYSMHAEQTWRGWETTRKFRTFWEQALAGLVQVPVGEEVAGLRYLSSHAQLPDVLLQGQNKQQATLLGCNGAKLA